MKKTLIFALFFVQWFDVVKAETPDEEPYQTLENLLPESASDISIYRWTLLDGTDETKTSYMPQRFCELLHTNEGGRYALLMPTDEALMSYVDAASLDGYSNPRMISILWKDGDFPIRTENYRYDAATGTVGRRLTGALASLNQSATVDYLTMMQKSHTIAFTRPEDAEKGLNSGNRYFQALDGSVIKVQKDGNGDLTGVQGAFQMQNEEAGLETFSQCAVEETWHKGNFDLYEIAQPVIHSPHSVQWVLKGDETECPFSAFYNLTCADKQCLTACGFTNVEELLPYISSLEDRLNYTSDAPFTLFVPTNGAIEQEIAKGLPTWESIRTHIDGHTTSDTNGNVVWDSEESRLSVAKECLTLINFIKAHVMKGVEIADQLPFTRTHASALVNSTGEAAQLEVSSEGNEQMTVSDGEHVRTVLTNKNIFTVDKVRSYPTGPISSTSARVFSYHPGVIHQIDGVLSYNKGGMSELPENYAYRPFVEEGKVWNIEKVYTWVGSPDYGIVRTEKCELKGDTVIGGVTYKKYYEEGVYRRAMREENKKVYIFNNNQEVLLYDFGLKEGERFTSSHDEEYVFTSEDYVEYDNKELRRMKLVNVNDSRYINYWIEGIGALAGPTTPFYYGMTGGEDTSIASCYVGDQCIYRRVSNSIQLPATDADKSSALFDLSGRKLNTTPQKGIYIREGKKYIHN